MHEYKFILANTEHKSPWENTSRNSLESWV